MSKPQTSIDLRRRIKAHLQRYLRKVNLGMAPSRPGVVRVTASGQRNPSARGDEVVILGALTADGTRVDLRRLAGGSFELMDTVHIAGAAPLPFGIRLTAGRSIDLPLGPGGWLHLLSHPWSGHALIQTIEQQRQVDLFNSISSIAPFAVNGLLPMLAEDVPWSGMDTSRSVAFAEDLERHMARLLRQNASLKGQAGADVLAIYTPRWKGVSAATHNLFGCALPVPLSADQHPDELEEATIRAIADAIAESPFQVLVFSGGDAAFFRLFEECRRRKPSLDFRLLWHGSYLQMGEAHDWNLMLPWLDAAQTRRLSRVGVVKPGMDHMLASHGIDAVFVQNAVPFRRQAARQPRANVAGIWLSGSSDYRKPVVPSLLAIAGVQGLKLRGAGLGEQGCRIIDELRISAEAAFSAPIPHPDVLAQMRQTAVTLYVTLSECMPMVPLESMAQGAPCLVGPATELFSEDRVLEELLVVRDPTDPASIRKALAGVLDDRQRLRERCEDFLELLNARSVGTVANFLN